MSETALALDFVGTIGARGEDGPPELGRLGDLGGGTGTGMGGKALSGGGEVGGERAWAGGGRPLT